MGGRASKSKGSRRERQVVQILRDAGESAERVPLSGSAGGSFSGDIEWLGRPWEVKARSSGQGWQTLERWLEQSEVAGLVLVADRQAPRVYLRLSDLLGLLHAEKHGPSESAIDGPSADAIGRADRPDS